MASPEPSAPTIVCVECGAADARFAGSVKPLGNQPGKTFFQCRQCNHLSWQSEHRINHTERNPP